LPRFLRLLDVPIRIDSYATLEPQGITGLNYVQISAGTPSLQLLKDTVPRKNVPRIRSEPSVLSNLLDGGSNVLARADEALGRINRILSDENIKRLSATLDDIQAISAELRNRKSIIADAERAVENVNEAAQQIGELAKSSNTLVNGDGRRSMARLADAARDLSTMMGKLESPTGDFATTGLPQITSAIARLQQTVDNLDRALDEVQQNPQGLLARPPAQEIEVKP
jgi:phospholipid/cholesterol/gamma-HCH transport system substrate-binding protein